MRCTVWLDSRMAAGQSHGFYRPYGRDRGGVAPERWHLSYAPLTVAYAQQFNSDLLASCGDCDEVAQGIPLRQEIDTQLPQIVTRYLCVPGDWCPAG